MNNGSPMSLCDLCEQASQIQHGSAKQALYANLATEEIRSLIGPVDRANSDLA